MFFHSAPKPTVTGCQFWTLGRLCHIAPCSLHHLLNLLLRGSPTGREQRAVMWGTGTQATVKQGCSGTCLHACLITRLPSISQAQGHILRLAAQAPMVTPADLLSHSSRHACSRSQAVATVAFPWGLVCAPPLPTGRRAHALCCPASLPSPPGPPSSSFSSQRRAAFLDTPPPHEHCPGLLPAYYVQCIVPNSGDTAGNKAEECPPSWRSCASEGERISKKPNMQCIVRWCWGEKQRRARRQREGERLLMGRRTLTHSGAELFTQEGSSCEDIGGRPSEAGGRVSVKVLRQVHADVCREEGYEAGAEGEQGESVDEAGSVRQRQTLWCQETGNRFIWVRQLGTGKLRARL